MSAPVPWTCLRVLQWTVGRFQERGLSSARLDAEVLLAHVLGCERIELYVQHDKPLAPEELERFRDLVRRRLRGEPVAYLVGEREFWSLRIGVDARVLVPRADTETLVEEAVALLEGRTAPLVLEVGAGSGAVAIALATERPDARIVAVELDPGAAEVARANARRCGVGVEVRVGDLLAPAADLGPLDLIVSNPPYVATAALAALPVEVRWEPRRALDGGPDGLVVIRRLVGAAAAALAPGGALALEIGAGQAPAVRALVGATEAFGPTAARRDLAGVERVLSARRR